MRETKGQFFCRSHFLSQSGIHRGFPPFHLCGIHTPHDNRNQASFHRDKSIHQQHSLWSLFPKRGIQHLTRKEGLTTNHHGFCFAQSLIHSLQERLTHGMPDHQTPHHHGCSYTHSNRYQSVMPTIVNCIAMDELVKSHIKSEK